MENDDDKLVVIPEQEETTDGEIEKIVEFQERWFKHKTVRKLLFKSKLKNELR